MKYIISTITFLALATQINAMTPTELIKQRNAKMHKSTHVKKHKPKKVTRRTNSKYGKHAKNRASTKKRKVARQIKQHRKSIDRKLSHKKMKNRRFRTVEEYRRLVRAPHKRVKKHRRSRKMKHATSRNARHFSRNDSRRHISRRSHHYSDRRYNNYDNGYDDYYDTCEVITPRRHTQRGYRHYRRQWYLAFLYERASFNDSYGYSYGYFNRRGFIFEGEFYRYDRSYTYRDRLRGRGMFDRRYYRPNNMFAFNFFEYFDRMNFRL